MRVFPSIAEIPVGLWRWPHFAPGEVADKMSGAVAVDEAFLDRMERLRAAYAKPMIVNSWYRTPEHNVVVSDTGETGPHTTGRAVDVRIYGAYALDLIRRAIDFGFTGVGVAQTGSLASRFVHLDDLAAPDYPRPTIWTY